MAKAKFNYRPVYFICGVLSLIVVLAMLIPDPYTNPSTAPVEQRNLLLVFKQEVAPEQHAKVIEAGEALVYVQFDERQYHIILKKDRVLEEAFDFFDKHPKVQRVSKGAVEAINLHRDMIPEFRR